MSQHTDVPGVRWISLTTHSDSRGRLTAIEGESQIPFAIARLFYLYGVAPGAERAAHAHPSTEQCLIAVSGALEVRVADSTNATSYRLDDPTVGLYIPPMTWVTLQNFTPYAVCLAVASTHYEQATVIRDWNEYLARSAASKAPRE
jgi:dTDP-4-dehydrorhamnose 3,5-epimerase-like enzyme